MMVDDVFDPTKVYVRTLFDRRGGCRGYAVCAPREWRAWASKSWVMKRFEKRTYLSNKLCFELATAMRDSLNKLARDDGDPSMALERMLLERDRGGY